MLKVKATIRKVKRDDSMMGVKWQNKMIAYYTRQHAALSLREPEKYMA